MLVCQYFMTRLRQSKVLAFAETRLRISADRYRVPDVCLYANRAVREEVLAAPPDVVIEVLSPEDRQTPMQARIDDYLILGVKAVWVVDPVAQRAWSHTRQGSLEAHDLSLRLSAPPLELPLRLVFAQMAEIDAFGEPA